jgi:hypothetical protein
LAYFSPLGVAVFDFTVIELDEAISQHNRVMKLQQK